MSVRSVCAVAALAAFLTMCPAARADNAASMPTTAPATTRPAEANTAAAETPWLVGRLDYRGDLWQRPALTGDWAGIRQELMDKGLRFDLSLTQVVQGNWDGGTAFHQPLQGNARYGAQLDTGKAGLLPGGLLTVKGETRYGKSDNSYTGAGMPVDTLSLFPQPGEDCVTALTDLYYTQFLAPWLAVYAGKMSPRETNVFASDETSQFMNMAFNFNPIIDTTLPLDFLMAGGTVYFTDWLNLSTMVLDSEGTATLAGFKTAFERGTSIYQMAELGIKPFNLPGHQRVGWSWSDKSRLQFEQSPRDIIHAILTGSTAGLSRQDSDWAITYDFDQYFYKVPDTKDRGIGLFGRFGVSDGVVNPVQNFYSLGVGGKGMIPGRERDNFGVGYYYLRLSEHLPRFIQARVEDEQGVEIFYNIAVTPWLHVTPDLQILDPARRSVGATVVAGIRMKIDF